MNRRGFLGRLAGTFGALATGQAVKFSDLKALFPEKTVAYRTYIFGKNSIINTLPSSSVVYYDKELIANLKGESAAFIDLCKYTSTPMAVGVNRKFFQYGLLGSNTLPGKTHECVLDESQKLPKESCIECGGSNNLAELACIDPVSLEPTGRCICDSR